MWKNRAKNVFFQILVSNRKKRLFIAFFFVDLKKRLFTNTNAAIVHEEIRLNPQFIRLASFNTYLVQSERSYEQSTKEVSWAG